MANLERYRSWEYFLCVFSLDQSSTLVKRPSTLDGALMSMRVCLRSGILKWRLRCVFYVIPATENGLPSVSAVVIVICEVGSVQATFSGPLVWLRKIVLLLVRNLGLRRAFGEGACDRLTKL
jgi:hypothetical protein